MTSRLVTALSISAGLALGLHLGGLGILVSVAAAFPLFVALSLKGSK